MSLVRSRWLLPAVAVVVADQSTKHWAVNSLGGGRVVHVIWTLQWAVGYNSGMAFSRGTGLGRYIGILATVAVVLMIGSLGRSGSSVARTGMSLVIGGALGNLADRVFRGSGFMNGSVVDFIDFRWFPVFNVADSAITIGGAMVVLSLVLSSRGHSRGATA